MTVNITELNDGAHMAHWFLIINGWTEGVLISGLLLIIAFVIFGIAKASGTPTSQAFLGSTFAMFLISATGWFVVWNGLRLVPTFMPVFFIIMTGIGLFMVIMEGVNINS